MSKILNLKPLILIILFNYFVIVFGPQVLYIIQINIERFLRPLAPRMLIGFIQATIGLVSILIWIFIWLKLYKYLFARVIKNKK
ncbi:MAG: hypothetical protein QXS51_00450 [Thermoproteota archaeon]|nr:hypothetical protein [Candidatus Brockarchaeota archaeon]